MLEYIISYTYIYIYIHYTYTYIYKRMYIYIYVYAHNRFGLVISCDCHHRFFTFYLGICNAYDSDVSRASPLLRPHLFCLDLLSLSAAVVPQSTQKKKKQPTSPEDRGIYSLACVFGLPPANLYYKYIYCIYTYSGDGSLLHYFWAKKMMNITKMTTRLLPGSHQGQEGS